MNKNYNEILEKIIGLNEFESKKIAQENAYTYRVTKEDDNGYIITCDFRIDRINVELYNGLVTKADIG